MRYKILVISLYQFQKMQFQGIMTPRLICIAGKLCYFAPDYVSTCLLIIGEHSQAAQGQCSGFCLEFPGAGLALLLSLLQFRRQLQCSSREGGLAYMQADTEGAHRACNACAFEHPSLHSLSRRRLLFLLSLISGSKDLQLSISSSALGMIRTNEHAEHPVSLALTSGK